MPRERKPPVAGILARVNSFGYAAEPAACLEADAAGREFYFPVPRPAIPAARGWSCPATAGQACDNARPALANRSRPAWGLPHCSLLIRSAGGRFRQSAIFSQRTQAGDGISVTDGRGG